MENDAESLLRLLDACHRVLPHLSDAQDEVAKVIRETCEAIEARLKAMGVPHGKAS